MADDAAPLGATPPLCPFPGCAKERKRWGKGYRPGCEDHPTGELTDNAQAIKSGDKPAKSKSEEKTEGMVSGWFAIPASLLLASGDEYCATAVAVQGAKIAEAWANVCEKMPALRKGTHQADKYLAVLNLATAAASLGLTVAVHHGAVKYNPALAIVGVPTPPPEPIEAEARPFPMPQAAGPPDGFPVTIPAA